MGKKKEQLYNKKGRRRWLEHSEGKEIDLIALPLKNITKDIKIYSFPLELADTDMIPVVAMPVSIIGFPEGHNSSVSFPIWKTGHIASEPEIDYRNQPLFLIDATTRGGMSGSPVVLRLNGGYKKKDGTESLVHSGISTLFMGVYSGRIPKDSEIGLVWRPHLIKEIIQL